MENKEKIEQFKAPDKPKHWEEEDHLDLITPQKATIHISRIRYIGENADPEKPKRCLSVTKNGKSVAFDIEMCQAVAAAMEELGMEFLPAELKG